MRVMRDKCKYRLLRITRLTCLKIYSSFRYCTLILNKFLIEISLTLSIHAVCMCICIYIYMRCMPLGVNGQNVAVINGQNENKIMFETTLYKSCFCSIIRQMKISSCFFVVHSISTNTHNIVLSIRHLRIIFPISRRNIGLN